MQYFIQHKTEYQYEYPVSLSQQLLHMAPRSDGYQICTRHSFDVLPIAAECFSRKDYFGNTVHQLLVQSSHQTLQVNSESAVSLTPRSISTLETEPSWESVRDALAMAHRPQKGNLPEVMQFMFNSPLIQLHQAVEAYASACFAPGRPLLQATHSLMQRIYQEFEFDPEATQVSTPLLQILQQKRGVCQDFAHLMIACMRSLGLACRYVSGYILTTPPQGQERLIGADASHAWVSVYCPGQGWVDFDPTNNCLVNLDHITVAYGRDFSDVTPMRGIVLGGGQQKLEVSVTVTPMPDLLALGLETTPTALVTPY